jgi:hypothetical protein
MRTSCLRGHGSVSRSSALLEALRYRAARLEIHLVGDGSIGAATRTWRAGYGPRGVHGQVNHHRVPSYIAAADLCLAPYRAQGFFHQSGCVFDPEDSGIHGLRENRSCVPVAILH